MDIKEQVWASTSKRQTISVVNYIGTDQNKFKKLVELFLGNDKELTQKSSWIYSYCIEAHPNLIIPYHIVLIKELERKHHHAIVRRSIMRSYQFAPIPTEFEGILFGLCIKNLTTSSEPVTLKVYSMATALRIVKRHHELKNELTTVIKMGLVNGSPAYLAWSRKILKGLSLIHQS